MVSFATYRLIWFQTSGSTGVASIFMTNAPSVHARTTVPWGSGFSMMAIQASTTVSLLNRKYDELYVSDIAVSIYLLVVFHTLLAKGAHSYGVGIFFQVHDRISVLDSEATTLGVIQWTHKNSVFLLIGRRISIVPCIRGCIITCTNFICRYVRHTSHWLALWCDRSFMLGDFH